MFIVAFDANVSCAQAICVITYTVDIRGTVNSNAYEGKCEESGVCRETCQIEGTVSKCYSCDVPATCEGRHISLLRNSGLIQCFMSIVHCNVYAPMRGLTVARGHGYPNF